MVESDSVGTMGKKPGRPTLEGDEAKQVQQDVKKLFAIFKENQSDMARAIGVSQPTVGAWVNGDSIPSQHNQTKILRILQKSTDGLRKSVFDIASGGPGALDIALLYWPDRFPEDVIRQARARSAKGETYSPQGWTIRMEEMANQRRDR